MDLERALDGMDDTEESIRFSNTISFYLMPPAMISEKAEDESGDKESGNRLEVKRIDLPRGIHARVYADGQVMFDFTESDTELS